MQRPLLVNGALSVLILVVIGAAGYFGLREWQPQQQSFETEGGVASGEASEVGQMSEIYPRQTSAPLATTPEPAKARGVPPLAFDQLKNVSSQKLTNPDTFKVETLGFVDGELNIGQRRSGYSTTMVSQYFVSGDIDTDGDMDAVTLVKDRTDGTGVWYALYVWENINGKPRFLQEIMLGDRPGLEEVTFKDGILEVVGTQYWTLKDVETVQYRWDPERGNFTKLQNNLIAGLEPPGQPIIVNNGTASSPFITIYPSTGDAPFLNIYRSSDGYTWQRVISKAPNRPSGGLIDSSLPEGAKILYYRVMAVDESANESAQSPAGSIFLGRDCVEPYPPRWKANNVAHNGDALYLKDGTVAEAVNCLDGTWMTTETVTSENVSVWGVAPTQVQPCVPQVGYYYSPLVGARFVPLVNGRVPDSCGQQN